VDNFNEASQQANARATAQSASAMNRYDAGEQRDLDALLSFGVSSGGTASVGSSEVVPEIRTAG
jgi:hypothetical protein